MTLPKSPHFHQAGSSSNLFHYKELTRNGAEELSPGTAFRARQAENAGRGVLDLVLRVGKRPA